MKRTIELVMLLGIALAGCSKPSAEEYYAAAQKADAESHARMDTVTSEAGARAVNQPVLDALQKLVVEYPNHELSEEALFRIANIFNNNTHEVQRAVDTYRLYIERYPQGKNAEVSMFLVGYLYNNELHSLDSAAAMYRRFLATYPQSQYAVSAQFELSTLGKPLEQLVPPTPVPEPASPKKHFAKKVR